MLGLVEMGSIIFLFLPAPPSVGTGREVWGQGPAFLTEFTSREGRAITNAS